MSDLPDAVDVTAEESLADRVRLARTERGWSQADLAERMRAVGFSWHQTTVSRVEGRTQTISLNEAIALAAMFGLALDGSAPPQRSYEPKPGSPAARRHEASRARLELFANACAERYFAGDEQPNLSIATQMGMSRSTVASLVMRARIAGFHTHLDGHASRRTNWPKPESWIACVACRTEWPCPPVASWYAARRGPFGTLRAVIAALREGGWVHSVEREVLTLSFDETVNVTAHIWSRGTERVDVTRWVGNAGVRFAAGYAANWDPTRMNWNRTADVTDEWVSRHGLPGLVTVARVTGVLSPFGGGSQ